MKYVSRVIHEIQFEVTRSSGPGGQNVNRTNSAVIARWTPLLSFGFTEDEKSRIAEKSQNVQTKDGEILIRSQESRDQEMNRKRCLEKLDELIAQCLFIPKKRKKTKPTRGSIERRIKQKKQRSDIKKRRQNKSWE